MLKKILIVAFLACLLSLALAATTLKPKSPIAQTPSSVYPEHANLEKKAFFGYHD